MAKKERKSKLEHRYDFAQKIKNHMSDELIDWAHEFLKQWKGNRPTARDALTHLKAISISLKGSPELYVLIGLGIHTKWLLNTSKLRNKKRLTDLQLVALDRAAKEKQIEKPQSYETALASVLNESGRNGVTVRSLLKLAPNSEETIGRAIRRLKSPNRKTVTDKIMP